MTERGRYKERCHP